MESIPAKPLLLGPRHGMGPVILLLQCLVMPSADTNANSASLLQRQRAIRLGTHIMSKGTAKALYYILIASNPPGRLFFATLWQSTAVQNSVCCLPCACLCHYTGA